MFTAAVALAVGAIPEGLPAAVTITLAIGVNRMARQRAVIRRMPAVETLGSTTVVCSDKTGTLTENQMTVRALWTPRGEVEVTGSGYQPDGALLTTDGSAAVPDRDAALWWTLVTGVLCNDTRLTHDDEGWGVIGDPTEGAMLVAAEKAGLDPTQLRADWPRVSAVPFNSDRQYMATMHHRDDDTTVILVKGAVERVLDLCGAQLAATGASEPLDPAAILAAVDDLARRGLRVLATANVTVSEGADLEIGALRGALVFTGLQAMLDPPRAAAIAAVRSCHTAGIDVKMITGDHAATATADRRAARDPHRPRAGQRADRPRPRRPRPGRVPGGGGGRVGVRPGVT